MDYLSIINIIFNILFTLITIMYIPFIIFGILGVFFKKKFKTANEQLKYGIVIPTRNEESVVVNLIKSIRKNKYNQDKLHIFVIAHNCTDNTAQEARNVGATVFEYNNENEKTKGYALKHGFEKIKEEWGYEEYDGFFIFDADNILDAHFFEKMNDAYLYGDKKNVVTPFRNSKNFGSNVMAAMYGLFFLFACRVNARGKIFAKCSAIVLGTGFLINPSMVENGWNYTSLTEDLEFTTDQIIKNNIVTYCDDAILYDEQPTSFKVMWKQRLRWAKGRLNCCINRFGDLMKALFSKNQKNKLSVYDITLNIIPVITPIIAMFLQLICMLITPFLGYSFNEVLLPFLIRLGIQLILTYLGTAALALLLYIIENKRIKNVSFGKKLLSALTFPFFILLNFILEVCAIFTKNLGWSSIPHQDITEFNDVNNKEDITLTRELNLKQITKKEKTKQ